MMRRVVWLRFLSLVCVGGWVAPLVMAQTGSNQQTGTSHKSAPNAVAYKQQPTAQKPAPAVTPSKTAATTNVQKQPAAVATKASPGYGNTQPVTSVPPKGSATTVPAQSVPAKATTPSMYTYKPSVSVEPKAPPAQTPTGGEYFPPGTTKKPPSLGGSSGGTSDGPPTNGSTSPPSKGNPPYSDGNPNGLQTTGGNTSPGTTKKPPAGGTSDGPPASPNPPKSGGTSDGLPTNGTKSPGAQLPPPSSYVPPRHKVPPPPPPRWPPRTPVETFPVTVIPPERTYVPPAREPQPPIKVSQPSVPPSEPPPSVAPPPQSPAPTMDTPQQPQQPIQPAPTAATPTPVAPRSDLPKPDVAKPPTAVVPLIVPDPVVPQTLPALTLMTKTNRPVVGKDVVVVAALEPALAGASYRLNWGDGSAVEMVSGSGQGTHHYAKAKLYKVSASTVVGTSELNHEILVNVGPVVPRIDWLLAALAGLAALFLHFPPVPKVTASVRWGAPGVPEMKLLSREPYLSLSFEPGVGPAEEDITFSKKRRKSGLEQG
jgi:hypothetical protein